MLCQLPHVGYELPKKWKVIRADLRDLAQEHNYISESQYFVACAKHGITKEEDQLLLSSYLHKLGSILHFQNETLLQDFVILNPQWAVDAVYCILEDKEVKEAQGVFTERRLSELWKNYERRERAMLLSMMRKENFEICYPISKDKYIAPQLLDNIQPTYDWDSTDSLKFRYQYRFLPKGVITRLIVRLNDNIAEESEHHPGLVWEKGVILEKNECRVQVIEEDFPRQSIEIEVVGKSVEKKYVLRWVREEIEAIHRKWFPNVRFEQKVPCICEECVNNIEPYFFDYSKMIKFYENGKMTDHCGESVKEISIRTLLEGIYEQKEYMPAYAKKMQLDLEEIKEITVKEATKTRNTFTNTVARLEVHIAAQFQSEYQEMKDYLDSAQFSDTQLRMWQERIDEALSDLSDKLSDKGVAEVKKAMEEAKSYSPKHKLKLGLSLFFAKYEVEYDLQEVWQDFRQFVKDHYDKKK
jgi:hypothetical protein